MACLRPYFEVAAHVIVFALQALPLSRTKEQDKIRSLAAGGYSYAVLAGSMESPALKKKQTNKLMS